MNPRALVTVLAAAGVAFTAASTAAEGQKLDSGLGDLPHYSTWADKSGRHAASHRVAGESLDSGLGELPAYTLWKDKSGRDPMGAQALQVASRR
jgi:hypothetical protein